MSYVWGAGEMKRTTIVGDEDTLRQMQYVAAQRGTSFTAVLHEAMSMYLAAQQPSSLDALIGIATTDTPVDYSDGRDEQVLEEGVHPIYGLSPEPPAGWGA